jgi:hypothetical protein
MHHKGILQLLMSSSAHGLMPYLSSRYNKLRSTHLSIISGLAKLILHLGGKEISSHNLEELTCNAEEEVIKLHAAIIPMEHGSPGTASPAPNTDGIDKDSDPPHQASKFRHDMDSCVRHRNLFPDTDSCVQQGNPFPYLPQRVEANGVTDKASTNIAQPPVTPKSSLKAGKFVLAFTIVTQSCPTDSTNADLDDDKDDPGLYGKMIDGVSNWMHLFIASFIKTNDKIRDQLLLNFAYFSELMCANIEGLKIHPISTGKPTPVLTSAKDVNMPTTGTKVSFF